VEGETLQQAAADPQTSLENVLDWLISICHAVEALHRHTPPLLLGELTPSAVRLDADGVPRVVSFGVADVAGHKLGTVSYSPPEQRRGTLDARSDVYALGATAYALLTGTTPPESTLLLDGEETLLSPARLNPDLPPLLKDTVLWMMDPRRESRPQSARQARVALERERSTLAPHQRLWAPRPISSAAPEPAGCARCGASGADNRPLCDACAALGSRGRRRRAILAMMAASILFVVGWAGMLVVEPLFDRPAGNVSQAQWDREIERARGEETARRKARLARDQEINARIARAGDEARRLREEMETLRNQEAEYNRLLVEAQRKRLAAQAELRQMRAALARREGPPPRDAWARLQRQLDRLALLDLGEAEARARVDEEERACAARMKRLEQERARQLALLRDAMAQAEALRKQDAAAILRQRTPILPTSIPGTSPSTRDAGGY